MRNWLRRAIIVAALAVIVLLTFLLVLRWWGARRLDSAVTTFEQEIGSLDPSRFALPELADEENASIWLMAGSRAIVVPDESVWVLKEAPETPIGDWSPGLIAEAENLLESNQPAFDLLARSLAVESSNFGIQYELGFEAEVPPVLELWKAGRLIRLDSLVALRRADYERLSQDIALLHRLGSALARESLLVTALISVSLDRLLIALAHDTVIWTAVDRSTLEDLGQKLQAGDSMAVLRRALASGALATARTPIDQFESNDESLLLRWSTRLLSPLSTADLLEGYVEMWGLLPHPYAEIREFYRSKQGLAAWNIFGILMPNLQDAIGKAKAVETSRALALEAMDLRLICLEAGAYPHTIDSDRLDPYGGGSISIESIGGSQPVLSAPRAVKLWHEEYAGVEHVESPPLVFELPLCGS